MELKELVKLLLTYGLVFTGLAMLLFPPSGIMSSEQRIVGFILFVIGGALFRFYPTHAVRITT